MQIEQVKQDDARTAMHRKKRAYRACGEAIAASIEERIGADQGFEAQVKGTEWRRGQRGNSEGGSDNQGSFKKISPSLSGNPRRRPWYLSHTENADAKGLERRLGECLLGKN